MPEVPVSRRGRISAWGWSLVASTLLHLVLLNLGGSSDGPVRARPDAATESIRLRLVSAEPSLTDSGPQAGGADRDPQPAVVKPREPRGGAAASGPPPHAREEQTLADYSDYFAKAYLTANPEPLSSIEIPAPDIAGKGTVQLELSVFIDDSGRVRRVRAETPGVMDAYVEAATRAFEATRFKPGEISGRAVKSVIRVVVEFQQP